MSLRYSVVQDRESGAYEVRVTTTNGQLVQCYKGLTRAKAGFLLGRLGGGHAIPILEVTGD